MSEATSKEPVWLDAAATARKFPKHPPLSNALVVAVKVLDDPRREKFVLIGCDRYDLDYAVLLFEYGSYGTIAGEISVATLADAERLARAMLDATPADLAARVYKAAGQAAVTGDSIDRRAAEGVDAAEARRRIAASVPSHPGDLEEEIAHMRAVALAWRVGTKS